MIRLVKYSKSGNDYFLLINDYGDVVVGSRKHITFVLAEYCKKYETTIAEAKLDITEDFSSLLYCAEYDTYYTIEMLRAEYRESADIDKEVFPTFSDWITEISGKNGQLKYI